MLLGDTMSVGIALPHRSSTLIGLGDVAHSARLADELGFHDLWVTENTIDSAYSLDPFVVLGYAAAVTKRIGLGMAVLILPLHHPVRAAQQIATLDYLSGGRTVVGLGLGRGSDYVQFQIPTDRRVRRFLEGVQIMREVWADRPFDFQGDIFRFPESVDGALIPPIVALKPTQKPNPPLWFGGTHPAAIRRAIAHADGWVGSGMQSNRDLARSMMLLRRELDVADRDRKDFSISKRVFIAVNEDATAAKAELTHWFGAVYGDPDLTETSGIYGSPREVQGRLEDLVETGLNHVILNPVSRFESQLETLASILDLEPGFEPRSEGRP